MKYNAQYIARDQIDFPRKLEQIKPEISGLWTRGERKLLACEKIVAIVGSRRMSRYGKQVLESIVPRFVDAGYTTISGFMYGIDVEMHRLTILNGGKTIGVFGWGIDVPVIPETEELYHKVLESDGLFISEMDPNKPGGLWTFTPRNRIVVGLSDMVVVVEAGIKSGSLNSAEWARKMEKPVYAIPGSIFSPVSEGCNYLIGKGWAKPLTLDFFTEMNKKNYSKKVRMSRNKYKMNNDESILFTQLRLEGPKSINELSRTLGMPSNQVSSILTKLLLIGEVQEERGIWTVAQ